MVLKTIYPLGVCDVFLTTAHKAKGLEYDHVQVLDDFGSLSDFEITERGNAQFLFKSWGDELNLW
jgi:ATP-dependent exoDNAse (exonuclease V) beta subunit